VTPTDDPLTGELLLSDDDVGVSVRLQDGVAVITYDQPGAPVNTLNTRVGPVFERVFDLIEQDARISAAVLRSGKPDSWIAGADIDELASLATAAQGEALSRGGQRLLDRLAALRKPVVAALHGATLGGGLEVALACRHRIASEHPKTILALPEVQLGLIPGAGGTQRLPRLVGLQVALDMMLTGKNVRGRSARWIAAAASLLLVSGLGIWVQRGTDPRREPFRGTAVAVMLVRPAADAPLRDGTKFEWRALARAENYELLVMDTDGKPVVRLETTDTFASVPDGLPAQGQWIVTARLPDGTTERSAARPFASAR